MALGDESKRFMRPSKYAKAPPAGGLDRHFGHTSESSFLLCVESTIDILCSLGSTLRA